MAVLTAALVRLRSDFNSRFPNRDKASDGWIGDKAHQASTSGHNPDDTVGSRSEYTDSDSTAEVRAIDIDDDLHDPAGITMQMVVDSILRTPADLARLKYMIYNRRMWSRKTGWKPVPYSGPSPHTEHVHFSGDPAKDEDNRPWWGVLGARRPAPRPEVKVLPVATSERGEKVIFGYVKGSTQNFVSNGLKRRPVTGRALAALRDEVAKDGGKSHVREYYTLSDLEETMGPLDVAA